MGNTTLAVSEVPPKSRDEVLEELAGPQGHRHQGPPTPARIKKLEQIKNVAAELFFDEGYAAMDIRSIAEAVDMHPSTLYNYISGKEGLLYLIMRDGLRDIRAGLDTAIASSSDPAVQLPTALISHLNHHIHRRHLAWVGHVEVRSLSGEFLDEVRRLRREYEETWIDLIERGMAVGVFTRRDPRLTMYGMLAIGQSLSRWYAPGTGKATEDEVCATFTSMALAGVLTRD